MAGAFRRGRQSAGGVARAGAERRPAPSCSTAARSAGASSCRHSPASCSCTRSAPPATTSSNTRSTPLATTTRTRASPARMTPIPGRPISMPACRRRAAASACCSGCRTAIRSPFPRASIGLNVMGRAEIRGLERTIRAVRHRARSMWRELLPDARWPQQIEMQAGKHMVRPRYEVIARRPAPHRPRQCRAHRSASPTRASPSSAICSARDICCRRRCCRATGWRSLALPTPMSTCQTRIAASGDPLRCRRPRGRAPPLRQARAPPRGDARRRRVAERVSASRRLRPHGAGLRFRRWRCRRRLAARPLPLRGSRQRARRRDQLRRACLQHRAHLQGRAAILCRPSARPLDPTLPAARRGALRHALPSDLSGVDAVARRSARPI